MANNIETRNKVGITTYLSSEAVRKNILKVVGAQNFQRFMSSIISAVQTTPALQECTNQSLLSAALLGESLKLSPSPQLGQYYMVPYKRKDKQGNAICEAQFQLGAKGYKQLAMRTGQYLDLDVICIHQGEYLGRDRFTGKQKFEFIEDDTIRDELPVVGYLAYFELLNGYRKQIYWTKEKMEKHADTYSAAFSLEKYRELQAGKIPAKDMWKYSSFWYKNFDEMADKTMIRQLISKWGYITAELGDAYIKDMSVLDENGNPRYIDNEKKVYMQVGQEIEQNANAQPFQIEQQEEPTTVAEVVETVQEKEPVKVKDVPKAEPVQEVAPFMQ